MDCIHHETRTSRKICVIFLCFVESVSEQYLFGADYTDVTESTFRRLRKKLNIQAYPCHRCVPPCGARAPETVSQ